MVMTIDMRRIRRVLDERKYGPPNPITVRDVKAQRRRDARGNPAKKKSKGASTKASEAKQPIEPCYFLQLPLEVRDMIYAYVFPARLRIKHKMLLRNCDQKYDFLPCLALTNRQLHAECHSAMLRHATYVLKSLDVVKEHFAPKRQNGPYNLRATKDVKNEILPYLRQIASFNKVLFVPKTFTRQSTSTQQFQHAVSFILELLEETKTDQQNVSIDMSYLFEWLNELKGHIWRSNNDNARIMPHVVQAIEDIEDSLVRSPQWQLESLPPQIYPTAWDPAVYEMMERVCERTGHQMLEPGVRKWW